MARLWQDNAYSTLASSLTNVATSLTVASGHGSRFPVVAGSDYFKATLVDASGNRETIKISAHTSASTTMTIVRAQDGTSARAWASGDIISMRANASAMTAYEAHIDSTSAAHAASAISYAGGTGMSATTVEAAIDELATEKADATALTAHIDDTTSVHASSSISYDPTASGMAATNVKAAIDELDAAVAAGGGDVSTHIGDTTAAHAASAISYVGNTNMAATDVEAAIDELDDEKGGLAVANTWTAGQRGEVTALSDGANIAVNLADSNNFSVTLAGNRTLSNPTNATAGQSGIIAVTQDATGSRTLAYGTNYKHAGGTEPVLTTTAAAVDLLSYYVVTATHIHISAVKDSK